jgi:uncharacterized protein (DUF58 family)
MKLRSNVLFDVHSSGKIYIGISIVLGILAINSGNNFHYLAAASVLGYMAASGEAGKRNIKGASVALAFPDEVYAGTPFSLQVELRNSKRFAPISLVDVEVCGKKIFFPSIQPGESRTEQVVVTLPTRGVAAIDGVTISSAYPFNLFTCSKPLQCKASVTVFPRPIRDQSVKFTSADEDDAAQGFLAANRSMELLSDSDVVGVRPYAEGDPMRLIHWKSSARTGSLKSRLYDSSGGGKIIDVDALAASGLERGLSIACGEIRETMASGAPIGMIEGGVLYFASSKAEKLSMLEVLALRE